MNRVEFYYVDTVKMKNEQNDNKSGKNTVTAQENLRNLVISAFNILGPLGSVFSSAMSNYLTSKRLAHIQGVLDAMTDKLALTPKECLWTVLASDEFLHLCITAMEKAQKEHRESKRRSYGVMLANMAVASDFQYDLFDHFLSLLSEIGDLHIKLVMELEGHGVKKKGDNDWIPFKQLENSCIAISPTQPKEVIASALQKLGAYGIVKTSGTRKPMINTNPVGLWYSCSYSITPTGEKFVEFLRN